MHCHESCTCHWPKSSETGQFFPDDISQGSVLQWFRRFNQGLISRKYYTSHNNQLADSLSFSVRKGDIFLALAIPHIEIGANGPCHNWVSVLVQGELKACQKVDASAETILQLAGYVCEVFGLQITRMFVYAFTIYGSVLRSYLFDRAGVSISERIHIRKNRVTQQLFTKILQAYVSMGQVQLVFNTNYKYAHSDHTNGRVFLPTLRNPALNF